MSGEKPDRGDAGIVSLDAFRKRRQAQTEAAGAVAKPAEGPDKPKEPSLDKDSNPGKIPDQRPAASSYESGEDETIKAELITWLADPQVQAGIEKLKQKKDFFINAQIRAQQEVVVRSDSTNPKYTDRALMDYLRNSTLHINEPRFPYILASIRVLKKRFGV